MSGQKPRTIALRVLQRQGSGEFVEDLLEQSLASAELSLPDRHLCQELVYGVVRWRATLDWLIARKTAARTQKPLLQNLLQLGLYQIFWLDRIPNHAAVNETVELAKRNGMGAQAGFINAVLRGYLREFEATRQLLAELKNSQPHLGYSHPEWLFLRWQQRWTRDQTIKLLDYNNTRPKTFARINTLKADPGKVLAQWREENVEYDFVRRDWFVDDLVFQLKSHPPLAQLPSFQQGYFYIQDPSTLLAIQLLDPQPGETVLDFCAAPGGKLTYIAQLMGNQGRIVAQELTPERLKLVEQNAGRLGANCIEAVLSSGLSSQTGLLFDRILIDAPCSNTGVMGRRVDLRWRIRPEEINRLHQVQTTLLNNAADLLKPGGVLVYSTCSLELEENEQAVEAATRSESALVLERHRQLLPFVDNVDGAYVARLKRRS